MPVELESLSQQSALSTDEKMKAIAKVLLEMADNIFRQHGDEGDYLIYLDLEKRLKALYKDL